ncbi:glycoside hydrolase family 16 protein [Hellea balneolensis]|uniref:glycoside hydrolase family 16 protein n=1 Tax=Hellea balneolensis TaxID=287478 RepID=UPI0004798E96|nr:glycoside hydrolase family 16 protein [Hellea balneolensis]
MSLAACQAISSDTEPLDGCRLTFSDDFSGSGAPDKTKWISKAYNRRPNENGPDGFWRQDAVRLNGQGHLEISVRQIQNQNRDTDPHDFASGMVSTQGKFEQQYGRFEIRARLPQRSGWWAAFWLFNKSGTGRSEDSQEIDIMEGFGWTDEIRNAHHRKSPGDVIFSRDNKVMVSGARDGFQTYRLDWTETDYIYFVNGQEVWRRPSGNAPSMPLYIKLSGEISTQDWLLTPNWASDLKSAAFPDEYLIDYVKVWEGCEPDI